MGETKVTATWGKLTGTATVKVTQPEPNAYDKITLSTSTFALTASGNGVDINSYMKVYKKDVKQGFHDDEFEYTSSDEDVATVEDYGWISPRGKGTATITVTAKANPQATATATVNVTTVEPTELKFKKAEYTIELSADEDENDKSLEFSKKPTNAGLNVKDLTFTSSDPSVAKITSKGSSYVWVLGRKPGEATITVKYSDAVVATAKVTVTAVDPTGVSISKKAYTLNYMRPTDGIQNSTSENIEWNLEPADAWYKEATWTSSDFGVAMVDDGYVWATGVGTATITLTVEDSTGAVKTATTTVNVTGKAINLALSKSSATITLTKGGANTLQLNAIDAKTKDDVSVNWKTSDKSVATVVDGLVTAKKAGKVTITAVTKDGNATKKSCKITVKPQKVTKLTATKKLTMTVGEKKALSVTVKPDNAFNTNLAYSSKSSVVSVDKNGKLTAKKAGKAVITVKTKDGSKKSVKITVTVNAKK